MEGKYVIVSVLIMSMVLVQIQVEAKICCPCPPCRNVYNFCMSEEGSTVETCETLSGCKEVSSWDNSCPPTYPFDILKSPGNAMNEYCKLGCEFSVCGALNAFQNSGKASGIVNGAAEQCVKGCSTFCTKGSKTALETA